MKDVYIRVILNLDSDYKFIRAKDIVNNFIDLVGSLDKDLPEEIESIDWSITNIKKEKTK